MIKKTKNCKKKDKLKDINDNKEFLLRSDQRFSDLNTVENIINKKNDKEKIKEIIYIMQ